MQNQVATEAQGLQGQFLDVFLFLGSEWILYVLLLLSIISVAVALERAVHFYKHRVQAETLSRDLGTCLNSHDLAGARSVLASDHSHVGYVLLQGVEALGRGTLAAEEIMVGAMQLERLKLERGLAFLGTLGNNAPFIGLFGTVLGIIRAFRDLATNTIEGSSAVMAGIAEALVATAVGLLVALPAVAIYNVFQRLVRTQVTTFEALMRQVLAYAKSNKE